jgi:hypothetical protein
MDAGQTGLHHLLIQVFRVEVQALPKVDSVGELLVGDPGVSVASVAASLIAAVAPIPGLLGLTSLGSLLRRLGLGMVGGWRKSTSVLLKVGHLLGGAILHAVARKPQ